MDIYKLVKLAKLLDEQQDYQAADTITEIMEKLAENDINAIKTAGLRDWYDYIKGQLGKAGQGIQRMKSGWNSNDLVPMLTETAGGFVDTGNAINDIEKGPPQTPDYAAISEAQRQQQQAAKLRHQENQQMQHNNLINVILSKAILATRSGQNGQSVLNNLMYQHKIDSTTANILKQKFQSLTTLPNPKLYGNRSNVPQP
jgi:hypothetical protein